MAVILSDSATLKEEAASLVAHLHIILQLAQDFGGRQWLLYDWKYHEWAAASNIKVWEELYLSIYVWQMHS